MIGIASNDAAPPTAPTGAPPEATGHAAHGAFRDVLERSARDLPDAEGETEADTDAGGVEEPRGLAALFDLRLADPRVKSRLKKGRDGEGQGPGEASDLPAGATPQPQNEGAPARADTDGPATTEQAEALRTAPLDPAEVQSLNIQLGQGGASASLDLARLPDGGLSLNLTADPQSEARMKAGLDDLRRRLAARGVQVSGSPVDIDRPVTAGRSAGDL